MFQSEATTVCAKALRQEFAWHVRGMARGLERLEHSGRDAEWELMRSGRWTVGQVRPHKPQ